MEVSSLIRRAPLWSQPPLAIVAQVVVFIAFVLVAAAIVIDFRNYHRQARGVERSDRSLVETGSMTLFFLAYYAVIRLGWLTVSMPRGARTAMVLVGTVVVAVGAAFNIYGRIALKSGWANQIKVYEGHELITTGPYALVRHPLYASLIWAFLGGALIYSNALALVMTLVIFVPMMYVRARKEEALLTQSFAEEYATYRGKTGMFLPRLWG